MHEDIGKHVRNETQGKDQSIKDDDRFPEKVLTLE
jgi:hypothetical protein